MILKKTGFDFLPGPGRNGRALPYRQDLRPTSNSAFKFPPQREPGIFLPRFRAEPIHKTRRARAPKVTASKLKPKRLYAPRIISDHSMVEEDFERLYKFLLETECLPEVSDDMRELIESEWPELVHKLPPKGY
jgi:hypothetical protein